MYDEILYEVDDPVATITLHRPEALNAWTARMGSEVRHAVHRAESDRSVVGIVVTGAGRAFCAGADLGNLAAITEGEPFTDDREPLPVPHAVEADRPPDLDGEYTYLMACAKPVIAAINGPCAGMAVPIALGCDLRFMADDAVILTAFAQRGLIAEWGLSWLLPRLVGPAAALDLLFSSRRVGGPEAAALGLVNASMPGDQLLDHCRRYVVDLAARCSPTSLRIMKRQVYAQLHAGLGAAEHESQRLMVESFGRPDFKEGVRSFLEKRPPSFERLGGPGGNPPPAHRSRTLAPAPSTAVSVPSKGPVSREAAMRALVYHGPGDKAWEEVADPALGADTDAVVRVDATTICGTDLHIMKGDVPTVTDGRILGHEAVGTVQEVGPGVKNVKPGDRVLVSCISACGACRFCREGRYGQCLGGGGWILGHTTNGTQAEYVRVPFADTSTHPAPAGVTDEQLLMLADILPTGYEVGVLNGHVAPGDVVAVVGAGPIGLAAIAGARLYSPAHVIAIDKAESRLEAAKQFGADVTVNNDRQDPLEVVAGLTDGLGADVGIEAVGVPATFELAAALIRPGGRVANIGVHGEPATLHLEDLWIRDVTVTTGLVDTYSTPTLLKLIVAHQLDAQRFVTHHFALDEMIEAYDVFGRAADTGALKVVLSRR